MTLHSFSIGTIVINFGETATVCGYHEAANALILEDANGMLSPLQYYLDTGRGSSQFLHNLLGTKPYIIARILAKGGSDSDIMSAIKRRIHF